MWLGDPGSSRHVLHHDGLVILPGELGIMIVHVEDDDLDNARSGEGRRTCGEKTQNVKFQSLCCRRTVIKTTAIARSVAALARFFALLSLFRVPIP